GIMFATAWLSMWMSNTAAAALMLGVAGPILYANNSKNREFDKENTHESTRAEIDSSSSFDTAVPPPLKSSFKKALILAIPFIATISGIATPIGTPPNALALGFLTVLHYSIPFVRWIAICFPLMVLLLPFSWRLLWRFTGLKNLAGRLPSLRLQAGC